MIFAIDDQIIIVLLRRCVKRFAKFHDVQPALTQSRADVTMKSSHTAAVAAVTPASDITAQQVTTVPAR